MREDRGRVAAFGVPGRAAPALLFTLWAAHAAIPAPAAAADYYVDAGSPQCSDTGPGSRARPFCSISAALAIHHAPGTTLHVLPGTYREQVTVGYSGQPGKAIRLIGEGDSAHPVVIDGAEDFGNTSLWAPYTGDVWLATSANGNAGQVLVDGARLLAWKGAPDSLPSGAFASVPGTGVYLNLGGPNPGNRAIEIGRRPFGFYVSHRSWVVIEGFTVVAAEDRGILLTNFCANVEVNRNTVRLSDGIGLQVDDGTAIRISGNALADNGDHGISLTSSTGCLVDGNESYRNAAPALLRGAGIYVYGSTGNRIHGNRFHHNFKAGETFEKDSNGNVSVGNAAWENGGAGFNHRGATGNLHNGDVAFGNQGDGFALIEGSTGTSLYNCVAAVNGLIHSRFDLTVDSVSTDGFASDDNVFWNPSGTAPVRYDHVLYGLVADYSAASGHDTRTLERDPRFVAPETGDFHPLPGSPLIDSANSGTPEWPATDAAGVGRVNDPSVPDRGLGPVSWADRGALEYDPAAWMPAAADTVPRLDHVIVVVMENKAYAKVRGAPYVSDLVSRSASFLSYYSYQHQSQSDYYALWGAVGRGVTESVCPATGSPYDTENLGHQCEAHGVSWRAYSEGLPAPGDTVCHVGFYVRRHCPWTDWGNLDHLNERPYTDLAADIAAGTLPNLAFVIPNLCDDTHDYCGQDTILIGDQWLADNVPQMIDAVGPRGLVVVTWDEDDGSDGNHILTTFTSPLAKTGYASPRYVNHFVLVRTICDALGLPPFALATSVDPITDVWIGQSPPTPLPPSPPPPPLSLGPVVPNPSRSSFSIELRLPSPVPVSAAVFDLAGRRMRTLIDGTRSGLIAIRWDGDSDAGERARPGVYLLRVRAGGSSFVKKLVRMGAAR